MGLQPLGRKGFRPALEGLESRVVPVVYITTVPDTANGGLNILRIIGDGSAQSVTINDTAGGNLNTVAVGVGGAENVVINGQVTKGGLTIGTAPGDPGVFTSISTVDVRLGGGNDTLTYNVSGFDTPANAQVRSVLIDMGAGNDQFTLTGGAANTTTFNGSTFSLRLAMGLGNDSVSVQTQNITNSRLSITSDMGLGNDTSSYDFAGTITANSAVTLTTNLGHGANRETVNVGGDLTVDSTLNYTVTGGANVDVVNLKLNDAKVTASSLTANATLGCGNDTFATTNTGMAITGGGAVSVTADGGQGNDQISAEGLASAVIGNGTAGLYDIDFRGGTGNDRISTVTNGIDNLSLGGGGDLRIRHDGGDGNDTLGLTLSNTDASTGNYDIVVNGGNGIDSASVTIADASAGVTYNPGGSVLLDGGAPAPSLAAGALNNRLVIGTQTTQKVRDLLDIRNFIVQP